MVLALWLLMSELGFAVGVRDVVHVATAFAVFIIAAACFGTDVDVMVVAIVNLLFVVSVCVLLDIACCPIINVSCRG